MPSVRRISPQARREVRGGVLLSSVHIWGRVLSIPACRLTDIKQAHPAYPFCTFFIPVSHRKGDRGTNLPSHLPKCTGKKGNSGKMGNPCIYWICRHRQEIHIPVLKGTDRKGNGNGSKKNPVKSRLSGYFLYIYSIFLYISPIIYIF